MPSDQTVNPWGKWIPGVLSDTQVKELLQSDLIVGNNLRIGPSSFDLAISDIGFWMKKGSVKPRGPGYENFIKSAGLAEEIKTDDDGVFLLDARKTYVFRIKERLRTRLFQGDIYGQATAKSSIGRVDVLARLIVDGMDKYEGFDPGTLGEADGEMYVEITPMTFNVKVKEGISITQLRLFYGNPNESIIKSLKWYGTALHGPGSKDGSLAVDLSPVMKGGQNVSAFCASRREGCDDYIPLWEEDKEGKPRAWEHWKFADLDDQRRLRITSGNFYILRSKEKVSLPPGVAIYCRAIDETIGEMRIHYAGFVHPYFGWELSDRDGHL